MPKLSSMTRRLATLGGDKWAVHIDARARANAGEQLIFLSIGEPDLPPPTAIFDVAEKQMRGGRTRYADGRGEPAVRAALSKLYTRQMGRAITYDQFLFLPGTQTALAISFLAILEAGDEVLLLDPYYATYEAVVTAPGGVPVGVALDPERGFHPDIAAIEKAVTKKTRAILLNSPSNPTGAVFTRAEIDAICEIAKRHDLWIVSDEVYAVLTHGAEFVSPFMRADLEERTIVVSSSKIAVGGWRGQRIFVRGLFQFPRPCCLASIRFCRMRWRLRLKMNSPKSRRCGQLMRSVALHCSRALKDRTVSNHACPKAACS
jgi:arginine:pyruvate transaminase